MIDRTSNKALVCVAVYYEMCGRRFEPTPTEDHIFRCEKCSFVYTDDADGELYRCPNAAP